MTKQLRSVRARLIPDLRERNLSAGLARAKALMEDIQATEIVEATGEYDLPAIAGLIERAFECDPETRRGLCLALADVLTTEGNLILEEWEPCRRPDGSSMLEAGPVT